MKRIYLLPIAIGILLTVQQAEGGGILLYETGTPEIGLAAAGWAARAQDAATVATNPAGMTRLNGDEMLTAAQLLYGDSKFSTNDFSSHDGGNGDNPIGFFPGASFYYSHSQSDKLKIGMAVYGNFGLSLDYGDEWAGRYEFQSGTLIGMTFAPTMAYKVTDKLSVGAGFNIMYGYFSNDVALNNLVPGTADGKLTISDTEWGYGANLGLMYEFSPDTRVGLQYTTEIKLNFSDTPDVSGLDPGLSTLLQSRGITNVELGLDMVVPQTAMFSFFHQLSDSVALLGNVGWQDWSEYGRLGVELTAENSKSLLVDRSYDDSYHIALGTQIDIDGPWLLSGGVAFDSGIVDDSTRTPDLPNGDSWRFSLGGQYALTENMLLGLGYTFLWMGDLDMDLQGGPLTGRLAGTYENANIQFFALNFTMRF